MTDESAKALAEAMNRLAGAIEALPRNNGLMGGIQVHHTGFPQQQQYWPSYYPSYPGNQQTTTMGGYASGAGNLGSAMQGGNRLG